MHFDADCSILRYFEARCILMQGMQQGMQHFDARSKSYSVWYLHFDAARCSIFRYGPAICFILRHFAA